MNYFIKCFQNYAVFTGRARRSEYWYFVLFLIIFEIVAAYISTILYNIFILASIIPMIAVGIRRMHDVGKSGWFGLIPIYNIILAVTEGAHGENQYGPDPKANL